MYEFVSKIDEILENKSLFAYHELPKTLKDK